MKKYLFLLSVFAIALFPTFVYAEENNLEPEKDIVAETVKYYKTITTYNNLALNAYGHNNYNTATKSESIEIGEEEYNNASETIISPSASGMTETTYKRMTTTIYQSGVYYTYKNELYWKTMPATRSFDIIGIGIYPTVKLQSPVFFNQYYCITGGGCTNSQFSTPKTFSTGAGAVFQLPTEKLSALIQTLYFDVAKNTTATMYGQTAIGDYSHATSTISYSNAQKFTVGIGGISLDSSISNYYDSIQEAEANWYGNW